VLESKNMAFLKNRAIWMLLLAAVLGGASCRIFKPGTMAYPTGLSFPVVEDASISFKGRIISPVRERGGAYFYSTENGFVRCVDGLKRNVIWTFKADNGLRTAPFPGKENIYVHDEADILYCLDSQGKISWTKAVGERVLTPIVEDSGRIYFGTDRGILWSLDLKGEGPRRFKAGAAINGGPLVLGSRIIFGSDDGKLSLIDPQGKALGVFQAPGRIIGPIASDGKIVFFSTETRDFFGLSLNGLRPKWKVRLGGRVLIDPVLRGGRLFLLSTNSVVYCLKKTSGDVLWWQNIPSRTAYELAVIEDKVVISTLSSHLLAFDVETGRKTGEYKTEQDLKTNALWIDPFLIIAQYDFQTDGGRFVYLRKDVQALLSAQKASPQSVGDEIPFAASAIGFFKPNYEFYLKTGEKREVAQKASETNTWTWYAEAEGSYSVGVNVTDEKQSREIEVPFVIEKRSEKIVESPLMKGNTAMTREQALELVNKHLKNGNLIKHCLAVEACMKAVALRLGQDPEPWGLAGLLHDLDYEVTKKSPELHTSETVKILNGLGMDPLIVHAVQAHAGKVPCANPMDWAIFSIDPLTGLIIAATLMHPTKTLKAIDLEFVKRRYKEKSFAKGVRRDEIEQCVNLGLSLDEFITICIQAMQGIDQDLGLA
jgi:putative nucleotidyltransferase with HDIG domain